MPDKARLLKRIEHGSAGTSFPGFSVPSPVWDLTDVPLEDLKQLVQAQKNRNSTVGQRVSCLQRVRPFVKVRAFTAEQSRKFGRIFGEFVQLLARDFANASSDLSAFTQLLAILKASNIGIADFVAQLAELAVCSQQDLDIPSTKVLESFLIGQLIFKETAATGSDDWWKRKRSESSKTGVFMDLDSFSAAARPVAHQSTCDLIEVHLLSVRPGAGYAQSGKGSRKQDGICAFTDEMGELTTSFPEPRVQALRPPNLKLFSASSESPCLRRYRMIESAIFPASKKTVARMQNAINKLAGQRDQRGKTWYPIPSNLSEKKKPKTDLLVAYVENDPQARAEIAEMFGGQSEAFTDADFEALTQPVFEAIEAKLKATPDLNLRLLIFSSIDMGRKQISLNRSFRIVDIIRAAKAWQAGARNVPDISAGLYNEVTKQSIFPTSPYPLELASMVNRVWSADAGSGFTSSFQRAISAADAYDVFMDESPLTRQKSEAALSLLIRRMTPVLVRIGLLKTTRKWGSLDQKIQWQALKAVAFLGILLRQLEERRETFMTEPIYKLGSLLALADRLHFHYCKAVRTSEDKRKKGEVDAPTELLGNSIFNLALDQPESALARLGERIKPYKGWADTYSGEDCQEVQNLLTYLAEAARGIAEGQLPTRTTDKDKAKLLLGYLADLEGVTTKG
jgi:hypothetical protein